VSTDGNECSLTTTVCIIGGGPAGATIGAYLAKEGIEHIIIEKEVFPRHHIGESLIATTTKIFHEIGVLSKIEAAGFVKKRGAVWVPKSGRGAHSIKLAPPPEFNSDHTYQVERAQFDKIMLEHSQSLGSRVIQPAQVIDIHKNEDGRVTGVKVRKGEKVIDVFAQIVVDASGQSTIIGSKLKLKNKDPKFDQLALYSYFENVDLGGKETNGYIHIFFLEAPKAWIWQIPISDKLTSIGIVSRKEEFQQKNGLSKEEYFWQHINSNPLFKQRMVNAKQADKFRIAKDYSFEMSQKSGPGFMLIGDAARFVDPIFSSGVGIAMSGAKFAFAEIKNILDEDKSEIQAFKDYDDLITRGTTVWSEFISIYYRMQNLFSYYIQDPAYKTELINLLQGSVYEEGAAEVLKRMRQDIKLIESDPTHLLHKSLVE